MVLLAPLFLIVAVSIKLSTPGPVFYRASRIGKDGVPFRLYKFRSMAVGAESQAPASRERKIEDYACRPFFPKDEAGCTSAVDNVFRGEMSWSAHALKDTRMSRTTRPINSRCCVSGR